MFFLNRNRKISKISDIFLLKSRNKAEPKMNLSKLFGMPKITLKSLSQKFLNMLIWKFFSDFDFNIFH